MSMHLEKPYLTTTGKKKGKKKWGSSAEKRKAEQLNAEWQSMIAKWETKPVAVKRKFNIESLSPAMSTPRAVPVAIPSKVTPGGDCTKKEPIMYTGTKVKGIATMHKSNAVPVFSDDEAIEISKMRR